MVNRFIQIDWANKSECEMKVWVSREPGGPETLVLEQWPTPSPSAEELLVRIQAVGVNFPDSLLIRDLYQVKPERPLVPGSEFCGVVESIGTGVTRFAPGDVVIGRCGWGAMSEYLALSQERCIKIPPDLPTAEAAAFQFAYATAYHALHDSGKLRAGETLLVLGAAGGVGAAAVEVGRALGAHVMAGASSAEKLGFAISRGAIGGLVYDATPQVGDGQKALAAELKKLLPSGADVVLDPVGGAYTEPALRSLARQGRHLVVGFTAGIPRVPLNLALLKRSHIIGVDWRMFIQEESAKNTRNMQTLLRMWQDGLLHPHITERFPFSAASEAIACLESRTARGKIVVTIDEA
ncbi:NADPH:quinone oxidoreductase family protein [Paraburkholderia sp. MM5482-R1]|uniref:NADPH:quinone oxidoreductase family protein n=1 Tax=unclassified Paraburkholderia TaxID=2615204 RepID=UPI003D1A3A7F